MAGLAGAGLGQGLPVHLLLPAGVPHHGGGAAYGDAGGDLAAGAVVVVYQPRGLYHEGDAAGRVHVLGDGEMVAAELLGLPLAEGAPARVALAAVLGVRYLALAVVQDVADAVVGLRHQRAALVEVALRAAGVVQVIGHVLAGRGIKKVEEVLPQGGGGVEGARRARLWSWRRGSAAAPSSMKELFASEEKALSPTLRTV